MKRFLLLAALCGTLISQAAGAQEIASVPAPKSNVTGIALQKAERITDDNFNKELRGQLNSVLVKAADGLGWQAQLVTPETLSWEMPRANAGNVVSQVSRALDASGYNVKIDDLGNHDGSTLKLLLATKKPQGQVAIGLWIISDQVTFLSWGFAAPKLSEGGDILVQGTPPLTEGLVLKYTDFLVWLFGKPELAKAKTQLSQLTAVYLADLWKRNAATAIAGTFTLLHGFSKRNAMSKDEQEGARLWLLSRLRQAAYDGEGDDVAGKTIMQVYELADPIVAKSKTGAPPLTKSARDAYVELQAFAFRNMPGGFAMNADEKEALGDWLVGAFPTWNVATQSRLNQVSLAWKSLQQDWDTLPAAQKNKIKAGWQQSLAPVAQSFRAQRVKLIQAKKEAEVAKQRAAAAKKTSSNGSSYDPGAYQRVLAKAQSSYRSYQMLSNMSWQMHYSRMNSIASWAAARIVT
jgi:hypothetical protein